MIDPALIHAALDRLDADESFHAAVARIQPGSFRRDVSDPGFAPRRRYTRELRRFVNDAAAMDEILIEPKLKERFFRLFGYRGALDFTIYPGTWLRDLPVLDIGRNVYLGERILLGTNQVSPCQTMIRVRPIVIGAATIFDQQCAVGHGTTIGANGKIGFRAAIGLGCRIGADVALQACARLGHNVRVGDGASVGYDASIGPFTLIEPGAQVPDQAAIPAGSRVAANGAVSPRRRAA